MSVKTVLLIGANGYVGSHVCSELLSRGVAVRALVRPGERPPPGTQALEGLLTDTEAWLPVCGEVDAVGFFAASRDSAVEAQLQQSVRQVMQRLRQGQRMALQGGSLVFGDTGPGPVDEGFPRRPPAPLAQRSDFERDLMGMASAPQSAACSVVYGSLVHGGSGAALPGALVAGALQARQVLCPDRSTTWSTVHVADWAVLIAHTLLSGPSEGGPFLAAGPAVAMDEVLSMIAGLAHLTLRSATVPELVQAYGMFGPALAMHQHFVARRAGGFYGWKPERNDLASSLAAVLPRPSR